MNVPGVWKKVLHQSLVHTTRFWCADSNYWGFSWSWFSLIGWDCDRSKSGREWNCRSNNWWCDCGSVSLAISLWLLQWVQTWLHQWVQAVAALECGWCGELFPSEQTLKIHIEVRAHQRGGERVQESTSQPLPPRRGKEQKWFNQAPPPPATDSLELALSIVLESAFFMSCHLSSTWEQKWFDPNPKTWQLWSPP